MSGSGRPNEGSDLTGREDIVHWLPWVVTGNGGNNCSNYPSCWVGGCGERGEVTEVITPGVSEPSLSSLGGRGRVGPVVFPGVISCNQCPPPPSPCLT